MRIVSPLAANSDRGAVGVLIGILISAGVLIGVAALAIDVGQIYHERAQLQNGADSGALAVAKGCAIGTDDCSDSTDPEGPAGWYANQNAKDLASAVSLVCGDGDAFDPCPESGGTLTECPVEIPDGEYVEVRTSTRTDEGSTLLPPSSARALAGNDGYEGTTVGACARASWGAPASATTVAMTISLCEWEEATKAGTEFADPPPYPPNDPPTPDHDQVMKLHTTVKKGEPAECGTDPAGKDGPGMFGWVDDDPSGSCSAFISEDEFNGDTGNDFPSGCPELLDAAWSSKKPIFIPVYTEVIEAGKKYTLAGFAAFVVTGYHLTGDPKDQRADWLNAANDCKNPDRCINGYFTQALLPSAGEIGGPDLGAMAIKLTG